MTPQLEIKREAPYRRGAELETLHFFCTCCRTVSLAPFAHGFNPHCKNDGCGSRWWNKPVLEMMFGGRK